MPGNGYGKAKRVARFSLNAFQEPAVSRQFLTQQRGPGGWQPCAETDSTCTPPLHNA